MEKDLFDNPIKRRKSKLESSLEKYDKEIFLSRVERYRWLNNILPKEYSFVMSMEAFYLKDEIFRAFINGEFVAAILLSQAFIEHWLCGLMTSKGHDKLSNKSLCEIIKFAKDNHIIHEFILEKTDELRKIRNPFIHPKPFDHEFNLSQRSLSKAQRPEEILLKDAQRAISLMYQIVTSKL